MAGMSARKTTGLERATAHVQGATIKLARGRRVAALASPVHEREWRAPGDVSFGWADVKFLIVPAPDWAAGQAHQYGVAYGEAYAQHFAAIPTVAIDTAGRLLSDGSGI
jgi:hypothetical protein